MDLEEAFTLVLEVILSKSGSFSDFFYLKWDW